MSYLIDTNVLSELRKKTATPAVVEWFKSINPESLYISVLTLGEIKKGIEQAESLKKRALLRDWLEVTLPAYFRGRVLPIDEAVAYRWGTMLAALNERRPAIDSLLAATAAFHDLVLVTRNTKDVAGLAVEVFNPWQD